MMKRIAKNWAVTLGLAVAMMAVSSQARAGDIVDTAVSAGSFNTLAAALKAGGLVEALKGDGPFTVFAPTDDAFNKLPAGTVETLLKPENKDKLVGILTYHVVKGSVPAAQVTKLNGAVTLNGQRVDISTSGSKVAVDKAQVVKADIKCDNGIIHVIDSVIIPETKDIATVASEAGSFSTLVAAAKAAGLVDALTGDKELTVFASTDAAFKKLPAGTVESLLKPENKEKLTQILLYHVVAGRVYSEAAVKLDAAKTLAGQEIKISVGNDGAKINNAKLVKTDIDAANGVIHVIDTVLLPPSNGATSSATHEEGGTRYTSAPRSTCSGK